MEKKFKTLYEYSVFVDKEVEVKEERQEDGKVITETRKEIKPVEYKLCIKKPKRSDLDEAELFYNVNIAQGMEAGLMSQAFLAKRYLNNGGVLSQEEIKERAQIYLDYWENESKLQKLSVKTDKTDEEEVERQLLIKAQFEMKTRLQNIEVRESNIFNITAESRARTKTNIWWGLNLMYIKNEKGEWERLYQGNTHEQRLASLDEIEEGDDVPKEKSQLYTKASEKGFLAIALWYYGKATDQDSIEAAIKEL
jgi:hypothetical protein